VDVLLAQSDWLGITWGVAQVLRDDDWFDSEEEGVDVRVRRRRQAVVVRRGDSADPLLAPPPSGRRRQPTLMGLDCRERQETLPVIEPPPSSRVRPVVLREDVDEQIIEEYRRQAALILSEGGLDEYEIVVD
jgi:hypothetical protein